MVSTDLCHYSARFIDSHAVNSFHSWFNQTSWPSFQRQLNLYGFRRLNRHGPERGSFYHEFFLRGKPYLTSMIVRTKIKGCQNRDVQRSAPTCLEEEPNFSEMPHLPRAPGEARNQDTVEPNPRSSPNEAFTTQNLGALHSSPRAHPRVESINDPVVGVYASGHPAYLPSTFISDRTAQAAIPYAAHDDQTNILTLLRTLDHVRTRNRILYQISMGFAAPYPTEWDPRVNQNFDFHVDESRKDPRFPHQH